MSGGEADSGVRVTVVTGGGGALGRVVVKRFLQEGYRVGVPCYSQEEADELETYVAESVEAHLPALGLALCDLTDPGSVADFFEEVGRREGRLDVLLNLAGGFAAAPAAETTVETWSRMLDMNTTTAFLASRAAIPALRLSPSGRIVNVASVPGVRGGGGGMAAYAAAKGAIWHLTTALAQELLPDRVTVNAIVPTTIDTPANRAAMPEADRSGWLAPEQIADLLLFLGSGREGAAIVTGTAVMLGIG